MTDIDNPFATSLLETLPPIQRAMDQLPHVPELRNRLSDLTVRIGVRAQDIAVTDTQLGAVVGQKHKNGKRHKALQALEAARVNMIIEVGDLVEESRDAINQAAAKSIDGRQAEVDQVIAALPHLLMAMEGEDKLPLEDMAVLRHQPKQDDVGDMLRSRLEDTQQRLEHTQDDQDRGLYEKMIALLQKTIGHYEKALEYKQQTDELRAAGKDLDQAANVLRELTKKTLGAEKG